MKKILIFFLVFLFVTSTGFAVGYTSVQSGDWTNNNTWGATAGNYPKTTDTATIANTHMVTINSSTTAAVYTVTINAVGILNMSEGANLSFDDTAGCGFGYIAGTLDLNGTVANKVNISVAGATPTNDWRGGLNNLRPWYARHAILDNYYGGNAKAGRIVWDNVNITNQGTYLYTSGLDAYSSFTNSEMTHRWYCYANGAPGTSGTITIDNITMLGNHYLLFNNHNVNLTFNNIKTTSARSAYLYLYQYTINLTFNNLSCPNCGITARSTVLNVDFACNNCDVGLGVTAETEAIYYRRMNFNNSNLIGGVKNWYLIRTPGSYIVSNNHNGVTNSYYGWFNETDLTDIYDTMGYVDFEFLEDDNVVMNEGILHIDEDANANNITILAASKLNITAWNTLWVDENISNANWVGIDYGNLTAGNVTTTAGATFFAESSNITMNGDFDLSGIGYLSNTTFDMNLTADGQFNITANSGSRFEIMNYTQLSSTNINFEYNIDIMNGAGFEMNNSGISEAGWNAANPGLMIRVDDANITYSNISLCFNGINFPNSNTSNVSLNLIHDNLNDGIQITTGVNHTIENNSIYNNGNVGIYLLTNSNENTVEQNYIHANTGDGLQIDSSFNNTVYNNMVYLNRHSMYLFNADWNNITLNIMHNMSNYGLYLRTSDNNTVYLNDIKNGTYGIYDSGDENNITFNNVYNFSLYGMYLTGAEDTRLVNNTVYDSWLYTIVMSNSGYSLVENNTLRNGSRELLVVSLSGYTNITTNSISNATIVGIDVDDSNYVRILNNTIFDNADDGIDLYSSNYSTVTSNNVTNNSNEGIELRDCLYSTIENNTVFNNTGDGINLQLTNYTSITDNDISNNSVGITTSTSTFNNITYNLVYNNSNVGMSLILSNYSRVQDNNVSGDLIAFMVWDSHYNNITYNNVFNSTWGLWVNETSSENIFRYLTIYNNTYGLNASEVNISNHYFANSTISNSTVYEVALDTYSLVTLLNVTFNKSSTNVIDTSVLTLRWYVDVQTVQSDYTAFPNALVRIYNISGIQLGWYTSDATGYIPRRTLVEYEEHSAGINTWNNYTFTGEFQTYFGTNNSNISTNEVRSVYIVMSATGGGGGGTSWSPTADMLIPKCGNGIIDEGEDCENCPQDMEAVRGEGYCYEIVKAEWPFPWWILLIVGGTLYVIYRQTDKQKDDKIKKVRTIQKARKLGRAEGRRIRPRYRRYRKWGTR